MTDKTTVELDTRVVGSGDLANIGLIDIADEVVKVGGEPNEAGTLPEAVRISGELTIEPTEK